MPFVYTQRNVPITTNISQKQSQLTNQNLQEKIPQESILTEDGSKNLEY